MTFDVLVCGAGPTGLLLAADLARRGVRPRVIEQSLGRAGHSKALAILPRTLEIFDQLGMIDEFRDRGRYVRGITCHAGKGKDLYLDFEALDSSHPYILTLPQFDTEALLARHVEGLGVKIERGVELRGFTDDGEAVHAELLHHSGSTEKFSVPWIVGCDGARSTVRDTLGLPRAGGRLERTFVFADALTEWSLPAYCTHPVFTASGVIMAIPLPTEGYWRVVLDVPKKQLEDGLPGLDFFERELSKRMGETVRMSDPQSVTQFAVSQRKALRYRKGRAFIAGDAAHIHSPVGGQGMNTGLQDAYNLGWKLTLTLQGRVTPDVLDAYEAEREPVAKHILALTNIMTRVSTMHGQVKPFMRRRGIALANTIPPAKRKLGHMLAGLSFAYGGSPVVTEDAPQRGLRRSRGPAAPSHSGPRAGAIAPDPQLTLPSGGTARLSQLADDTAHRVLLFHGRRRDDHASRRLEAVEQDLRGRFDHSVTIHHVRATAAAPTDTSGSELWDPSGACHDAFGAGAGTCYVIRPDRHVGYRGHRPDARRLHPHLCKTFY